MASLFSPKIPKTQLPTPSVPAIPEIESAEDLTKFTKKRYGRGQTVRAGALAPKNIGKTSLLGGNLEDYLLS